MQFLAQIRLQDVDPDGGDLMSIFMCQNDPGLCDEWDAVAGGNAAFVFGPNSLEFAAVPEGENTRLAEVSAVDFVPVESDDYDHERERWQQDTGRPVRDVLGQAGGQPAWIQDDETPACEVCDQTMSFVVQLEEGHNHQTGANFGGGCGYGFCCSTCRTAAFLWQQ